MPNAKKRKNSESKDDDDCCVENDDKNDNDDRRPCPKKSKPDSNPDREPDSNPATELSSKPVRKVSSIVEMMMMKISESTDSKTIYDKNKPAENKTPSKVIKTSKTLTLPSNPVITKKSDKNVLPIRDKNKPLRVGPGETKKKELKPSAKKKQEEGKLRESMAGWLIRDRKKYFEEKISTNQEEKNTPRQETSKEETKKTRRKPITTVKAEGQEEKEENSKLLQSDLLKPKTRRMTVL